MERNGSNGAHEKFTVIREMVSVQILCVVYQINIELFKINKTHTTLNF